MEEQDQRLSTDETPKRNLPRRGSVSSRVSSAPDERLGFDRNTFDRVDDDDRRALEDEQFEAFRDSTTQSVLPNLPTMPGYHVCWLTTTNQRDSVAQRLRMGYELIRADDFPARDWSQATAKTGDYAGIIAVNEMVAARIPLSLYNRYMRHVHHDQPLDEEEKLRSQVDAMQDDMQSRGASIMEGDGTAGLVQRAKPMVFTE